MAISNNDLAVLRLILRTPERGAGWRHVSFQCWPLIMGFEEKQLLEIDEENWKVRLSPDGLTIAKYVL